MNHLFVDLLSSLHSSAALLYKVVGKNTVWDHDINQTLRNIRHVVNMLEHCESGSSHNVTGAHGECSCESCKGFDAAQHFDRNKKSDMLFTKDP